MAERERDEWWRITGRWSLAGAVVGLGPALWFAVTEGSTLPGFAAFLPLCAALALGLRYSVYRFDYVQVWGWPALGLLALCVGGLLGLGIVGTCAAGGCGG